MCIRDSAGVVGVNHQHRAQPSLGENIQQPIIDPFGQDDRLSAVDAQAL